MGTLIVQGILLTMAAASSGFGLYWPWVLWILKRRGVVTEIIAVEETWTNGSRGYLLTFKDHHGNLQMIGTPKLPPRAGGSYGRVVYDERQPKRARTFPLDLGWLWVLVPTQIPALILCVIAANL
ncbi:hypothetical protein [Micromonospora sp. NPDC050200]|uniref:hypothetical protein n=1 Tax=Micromonospora sp. NPDC050200 TaxID=3155664 RepID=UPI00340B5FF1